MKIDLHKAFDSVHRDFLRELLNHLKFPPQFTKWIMACVTTVAYTAIINVFQGAEFIGGQGLK